MKKKVAWVNSHENIRLLQAAMPTGHLLLLPAGNMPVSYTHLDVYKRQVLPLGYSFNLDGSMMYMTFASMFIAQAYNITSITGDLTQQIIMPVSYTHLDVYKRQVL